MKALFPSPLLFRSYILSQQIMLSGRGHGAPLALYVVRYAMWARGPGGLVYMCVYITGPPYCRTKRVKVVKCRSTPLMYQMVRCWLFQFAKINIDLLGVVMIEMLLVVAYYKATVHTDCQACLMWPQYYSHAYVSAQSASVPFSCITPNKHHYIFYKFDILIRLKTYLVCAF